MAQGVFFFWGGGGDETGSDARKYMRKFLL